MEKKPRQDGGPPNARPTTGTGVTFANRRQKNLQKFRRHMQAQRQPSTGNAAPLETKPSKEAAPVVEAKPAIKPAAKANNSKEREAVVDKSETPQSPTPTRKGGTEEAAQPATMSPLAASSRRRSDIFKKLAKKKIHDREGPMSPKSPKSPRSHDGSSSTSTLQQQDNVTPTPSLSLSMTESTDTWKSDKSRPHFNLKMKPLSRLAGEVVEDQNCELEDSNQASENAQSKVQEKITSKPSEEALKPKTNNRLKARRNLHHHHHKKKFGTDVGKTREDKVAKGSTSLSTVNGTGPPEGRQSKDVAAKEDSTKSRQDAANPFKEHKASLAVDSSAQPATTKVVTEPPPIDSLSTKVATIITSAESQYAPKTPTTVKQHVPSSTTTQAQVATTSKSTVSKLAVLEATPSQSTVKQKASTTTSKFRESLTAASTAKKDVPAARTEAQPTGSSTTQLEEASPTESTTKQDTQAATALADKASNSPDLASKQSTMESKEATGSIELDTQQVLDHVTTKLEKASGSAAAEPEPMPTQANSTKVTPDQTASQSTEDWKPPTSKVSSGELNKSEGSTHVEGPQEHLEPDTSDAPTAILSNYEDFTAVKDPKEHCKPQSLEAPKTSNLTKSENSAPVEEPEEHLEPDTSDAPTAILSKYEDLTAVEDSKEPCKPQSLEARKASNLTKFEDPAPVEEPEERCKPQTLDAPKSDLANSEGSSPREEPKEHCKPRSLGAPTSNLTMFEDSAPVEEPKENLKPKTLEAPTDNITNSEDTTPLEESEEHCKPQTLEAPTGDPANSEAMSASVKEMKEEWKPPTLRSTTGNLANLEDSAPVKGPTEVEEVSTEEVAAVKETNNFGEKKVSAVPETETTANECLDALDEAVEGFDVDFEQVGADSRELDQNIDMESRNKDSFGDVKRSDLKVDVEVGDKENDGTDKGKATPQSDIVETPNSFDLRSIHEFPPEHIQDASSVLPTADPSWDSAKVCFTEFKQPFSSQQKGDTLNLVDTTETTSRGANNTIAFAGFETFTDIFAAGSSFSEVFEEKKELDHSALHLNLESTTQSAPITPMDSPESNASPRRRLSRAKVNDSKNRVEFDISNLATDSTDELGKCKDPEEDKNNGDFFADNKDDENLLGEKATGDSDSWEDEANVPKEERLQTYIANLDEDNSSITSSKADEEEEASHASEEPPAVEYMFQPEGANNNEDDDTLHGQDQEAFMIQEVVEDAPQLALSADAASSADQNSLEALAEKVDTLGEVSEPASSLPGATPIPQAVDSMESVSASNSEVAKPVPVPSVEQRGTVGNVVSNSSSSMSCSASSSDDREGIKDPKAVEENASTTSNATSEAEKDSAALANLDLEDSASLVGVELVPSFGPHSNRTGASPSGQTKTRDGMPPRSLNFGVLSPPPPPPLSKRKKRKKKKKSSSTSRNKKDVPLIAPPPDEKLKQWEASTKRAAMFLGVLKESQSQETQDPPSGDQTVEDMVCGALPDLHTMPTESPGRINLACGNFQGGPWVTTPNLGQDDIRCGNFPTSQTGLTSQQCIGLPGDTDLTPSGPGRTGCGSALTMAGLKVSPKESQDPAIPKPSPSPMDTARSIALENAMRRANKGVGARFDFPSPHVRKSKMDTKALFENEFVASASMGSSISMEEDETTPVPSKGAESYHESNKVEEPPELKRKEMPSIDLGRSTDKAVMFLHELTSPSLSMPSPPKEGDLTSNTSKQIGATSPLIHDAKMAEKAALASYAAAATFEEQYTANATSYQSSDGGDAGNIDTGADPEAGIPSLFCAHELEEKFQRMAGEDAAEGLNSFFFASEEQEQNFVEMLEATSGMPLKSFVSGSQSREAPDEFQGLQRGAFSPWRNAMCTRKNSSRGQSNNGSSVSNSLSAPTTSSSKDSIDKQVTRSASGQELLDIHDWLRKKVLGMDEQPPALKHVSNDALRDEITRLLDDDENLNKLCVYISEKANLKIQLENEERATRNAPLSPRKEIKPFQLSMKLSGQKSSSVVAANFVSFIYRISKSSGIPSPFGEDNPFLLDLVGTSLSGLSTPKMTDTIEISDGTTMQKIVFSRCTTDTIVRFCIEVCGGLGVEGEEVSSVGIVPSDDSSFDLIEATRAACRSPTKKSMNPFFGEEQKILLQHPSPFETAVQKKPNILSTILSFLGDPVAVCRVKVTNRSCRDYIANNEQLLMRDAVRLGGLSMNLRPSFWLWVTLEKCGREASAGAVDKTDTRNRLLRLEERGRTGKWHNVIQRDVARSFGNMPPHKTGARLRTDSIVRALVTWGRNRIMKRGVKGDGNPPPSENDAYGDSSASEGSHQTPTDTVSDWGGVSPVASFTGSCNGAAEGEDSRRSRDSQSVEAELLVLSGNALSEEMKADLQAKLAFILHSLAAEHEVVGYCQGMDYVVAHLLRILQDTICWRAANGTLPSSIHSSKPAARVSNAESSADGMEAEETDKTLVVEDTVFQVMDCFFTTYNLQHMYWPELRCLKTCCKVFERLIQLKLPVLADHFEHHELNVGIFALGWFQTLFLYLPSMPSATVCHMWDIWLVERSFKIFFRVGTAILFLSQPTLLNHELEGMQIYLNTFPDATLLNPDILIACALQIKVTNKMLMEIEEEVGSTID